jgi:hypothetical protein
MIIQNSTLGGLRVCNTWAVAVDSIFPLIVASATATFTAPTTMVSLEAAVGPALDAAPTILGTKVEQWYAPSVSVLPPDDAPVEIGLHLHSMNYETW